MGNGKIRQQPLFVALLCGFLLGNLGSSCADDQHPVPSDVGIVSDGDVHSDVHTRCVQLVYEKEVDDKLQPWFTKTLMTYEFDKIDRGTPLYVKDVWIVVYDPMGQIITLQEQASWYKHRVGVSGSSAWLAYEEAGGKKLLDNTVNVNNLQLEGWIERPRVYEPVRYVANLLVCDEK